MVEQLLSWHCANLEIFNIVNGNFWFCLCAQFEIFVTIASGNLGATPDYLKPSVSFSKFLEKAI